MPHIGVLFEVRRAETRPGETLSVVGGRPELGNWDPFDYKAAAGLQLRTAATQYPRWSMSAPVWIELGGGDDDDEEEESPSSRDGADSAVSEVTTPASRYEHAGSADCLAQDDAALGPSISDNAVAWSRDGAFIRLEYKYVKDRRQLKDLPSIQWEDSIADRRVMIPQEPGSIWIVSDVKFNDSSEPLIRRTTLAEVLARRVDLDPEWTSYQRVQRVQELDFEAPEWAMPHREGSAPNLSSPGSFSTDFSQHTTSTILMM